MAGRVSRGFALLRASWNVLKQDKELMLFPVLSCVACLLVLASFSSPLLFVPGLAGQVFGESGEEAQGSGQVWFYVGLFLYYFASYFVVIFFNTALVSCALTRFQGGDPTVRDGLAAASARLPQIAAWALVSATVGLALRAIEERVKLVGKIILRLIGAAWTIATFFVVPVLAAEKLGPAAAIRRSAELLRKTWGESLAGQVSLSLVNILLALPGILVLVLGFFAATVSQSLWPVVLLSSLGVLYLIVLVIATSTMQQIFVAGTYLYASTGQVTNGFPEDLMRSAFRKKGK